ncbi:hypothetical protein HAZT_HAZT005880 [Hyalella azteca]|uniref:C2H2-type domain-containing protein n=1 Tax=Hyalella azteca TaxID=294128 RepID=A0A6A0HDM6_HYAAZ|nr:hypothetical protein HAZT_HAZT005880 [Hyalella azteca]
MSSKTGESESASQSFSADSTSDVQASYAIACGISCDGNETSEVIPKTEVASPETNLEASETLEDRLAKRNALLPPRQRRRIAPDPALTCVICTRVFRTTNAQRKHVAVYSDNLMTTANVCTTATRNCSVDTVVMYLSANGGDHLSYVAKDASLLNSDGIKSATNVFEPNETIVIDMSENSLNESKSRDSVIDPNEFCLHPTEVTSQASSKKGEVEKFRDACITDRQTVRKDSLDVTTESIDGINFNEEVRVHTNLVESADIDDQNNDSSSIDGVVNRTSTASPTENISLIPSDIDVLRLGIDELLAEDKKAVSLTKTGKITRVHASSGRGIDKEKDGITHSTATTDITSVSSSDDKPSWELVTPSQGPFPCQVCSKVFNRKWNLEQHEGLHFPERQRYLCRLCQRSFAYRTTYLAHRRSHDHTTTTVACLHCGMWLIVGVQYLVFALKLLCVLSFEKQFEFKSRGAMMAHERRIHQRTKPHKCCSCDRSFHQRAELAYHLRYVGVGYLRYVV